MEWGCDEPLAKVWNIQLTFILKVLTNTVVGSTHHSSHLWPNHGVRTLQSKCLSQGFVLGW